MKKVTNSVINRSTQINKLCQPRDGQKDNMSAAVDILNENKQLLGGYYYLFMVQVRSGCRISEALSVHSRDISKTGYVLIRGLKGSRDRVCYIPELLEINKNILICNDGLFAHFNRFTAYRLLKNIGIGKLKKGRKNRSVTHVFRDEFVKDVRTTQASSRTTSDSIGHRSINSTEYYGKD